MHFPTHEQKQALLEQVLRIADQRLGAAGAKEARAFISQYYDNVDPEDLADRAPEDLYGAAMAHLSFARVFAAGMPKLRVYNPRVEEHGWSSPHTGPSRQRYMPLRVDSVTMEVNRLAHAAPLQPPHHRHPGDPKPAQVIGPRARGAQNAVHVEVDHEIDPSR